MENRLIYLITYSDGKNSFWEREDFGKYSLENVISYAEIKEFEDDFNPGSGSLAVCSFKIDSIIPIDNHPLIQELKTSSDEKRILEILSKHEYWLNKVDLSKFNQEVFLTRLIELEPRSILHFARDNKDNKELYIKLISNALEKNLIRLDNIDFSIYDLKLLDLSKFTNDLLSNETIDSKSYNKLINSLIAKKIRFDSRHIDFYRLGNIELYCQILIDIYKDGSYRLKHYPWHIKEMKSRYFDICRQVILHNRTAIQYVKQSNIEYGYLTPAQYEELVNLSESE